MSSLTFPVSLMSLAPAATLAAIAAAGLALGAAGSAHCAVMCGPLAALSQPRGASAAAVRRHAAAYNVGRIVTYFVLGALAGLGGSWIVSNGFGRVLSIAAAIVLIVQALTAWRLRQGRAWPVLTRAIGPAGRWMRAHPVMGPIAFGALSGLLPCGLVYAALTAAFGLGGALDAATFMTAFGLGNTPVLAAIGWSAAAARSRNSLRLLQRAAPAGLLIAALLLVMRAAVPHTNHGTANHPSAATPASAQHHGNH